MVSTIENNDMGFWIRKSKMKLVKCYVEAVMESHVRRTCAYRLWRVTSKWFGHGDSMM